MAKMCPRLTHLEMREMSYLSEEGRMSMVSLFRQITQNNPQIQTLNMDTFSVNNDREQNIGELVLESLLCSDIDSITDLNLVSNSSWFKHPDS